MSKTTTQINSIGVEDNNAVTAEAKRSRLLALRTDIYFRWAFLVVISCSIAYFLATYIPNVNPVIAAVTAAALVQGTVHESVKESIIQIFGIMLAIILGLTADKIIGFGPLTFTLVIIVGFTVGYLFKMKIENAVTMIIPIILVVGGAIFTVHTVEERVFGFLLGATVAIFASYITRSGRPTDRFTKILSDNSYTTSEIMKDIANNIESHNINVDKTKIWVEKLTELLDNTSHIRKEAISAVEQSKFSPFFKKEDMEKVVRQASLNITVISTVLNMAKGLELAIESAVFYNDDHYLFPDSVASELKEHVSVSANIISAQAHGTTSVEAALPVHLDTEDIEIIKNLQQDTATAVKELEDTAPLILSSSILQDSTKIKETLVEKNNSDKRDKSEDNID